MKESPKTRPRCPACSSAMTALLHREGDSSPTPYRDPVDGAQVYRCKTHGRYTVRDGSIIKETVPTA